MQPGHVTGQQSSQSDRDLDHRPPRPAGLDACAVIPARSAAHATGSLRTAANRDRMSSSVLADAAGARGAGWPAVRYLRQQRAARRAETALRYAESRTARVKNTVELRLVTSQMPRMADRGQSARYTYDPQPTDVRICRCAGIA